MNYQGKRVLVTGGNGLIGVPLVKKLLKRCAKVRVASMGKQVDHGWPSYFEPEFCHGNLTHWSFCQKIMEGIDYVFHLAGTKAGRSVELRPRPASFFVPQLVFNAQVMEAARMADVQRYLFTSSIGVYGAEPKPYLEDEAWLGEPTKANWYQGWAKRMGEMQAAAYREEFGWDAVTIVRPGNTYGPHDNFHAPASMVIPSLIRRGVEAQAGEPFDVWGAGNAHRDFVYSDDVAEGMLLAMDQEPGLVLNLGGSPQPVWRVAEIIASELDRKIRNNPDKGGGDMFKAVDSTRARALGWEPKVSLEEGIKRTIAWYKDNPANLNPRYDVFTSGPQLLGLGVDDEDERLS